MPKKGHEVLPDRSHPDTTNRGLSIEERKSDIARLRDVAQALRTLAGRLEGLYDADTGGTIARDINIFASQLEAAANQRVDVIRQEVFAFTGDRDGQMGGRHHEGGRKFR